MPATFTSLPIAVPSLFAKLVQRVSDNIGTDVAFLHGTWNHIVNRLVAQGQSDAQKNIRYPLICLLHDFEETFTTDTKYYDVRLTLLVCNLSTDAKYSEDRYADNYLPVLYPIYAELMQVIADSNYFVGYERAYPKHTKVDDLHMGDESADGHRAYKLPDILDGIWIKDLELRINTRSCSFGSTAIVAPGNLAYETLCYEATITATGKQLTIDAMFTNWGDSNYTPTPIQLVNVQDGNGEVLCDFNDTVSFDLSAQPDGIYVGYILQSDGISDVRMYFTYEVKGANIVNYTTYALFNLSDIQLTKVGIPMTVSVRYNHSSVQVESMTVTRDAEVLYTLPQAGLLQFTGLKSFTCLAGIDIAIQELNQNIVVNGQTLSNEIKFIIN